ncbi:MAG: trimethylamine methyltransferase family protein [Desulfobacterales bacterium]|nr:trimethylamine methyltransferase family protein [Desulfobacterales bacterium]
MTHSKEVKAIHKCSLRILSEIGIRFHCEKSVEMLKAYGFETDGDVVKFDEDKLMPLIEQTPSTISFEAKNKRWSTCVGHDRSEFLPGYGIPIIMEADRSTRYATCADYTKVVKLFEVSDLFNFNGLTLHPEELPADYAATLMLLDTLLHSEKNLLLPMGSTKELPLLFDILKLWFEKELENRARVTTIINTLSPLQMSRDTLENIHAYAEHGQPIIVTGGVMAGASGPITSAGAMAVGNAETLAAIALAQLVRPKTPAVYGASIPAADMSTGSWVLCGPERTKSIKQLSKALGTFYGLPTRNNGSVCDAQGVNIQAGAESMASLMAAQDAGINMHMYSAGTIGSVSIFSYEKFISDLDMLTWIRNYDTPIEVNENTLAFDVIKDVGIGKEYLTHRHTFANCRSLWASKQWVHRHANTAINDYDELIERGQKEVDKMLNAYKAPKVDLNQHQEAQKLLSHHGISYQNYFSA